MKLILWDLDGTLCQHNEQFHSDAPIAVAKAAIKLGAKLSIEEAIVFAKQNYPGQRTAVNAFAKRFNIDSDVLFQHYYKLLNDDFLFLDKGLVKVFKDNKYNYEYGVLTNASFYWAKKALCKIGLYDLFNSDFIFGYDELGQRLKTDKYAFNDMLGVCNNAGYDDKNIIIIDDKSKVLNSMDNDDIIKLLFTASNLTGIFSTLK